jgi:hypothetical protein
MANNDKGVAGDDDGLIPIDKDKLKDEQKAELKQALDAYEQECLKAFSTNRSGEVIKKLNFPSLQPLSEAQRENRILGMVNQAVAHAFIDHSNVMTNTVHNAVLNTLIGKGTQGFVGPCYRAPHLMHNAPPRSSIDGSSATTSS